MSLTSPADPRRSYTTAEVAQRLGVSLQSVQRWVDAGDLLAWKTPGGHRRIDAASADAFAERAQAAGLRSAAAAHPVVVVVVDDNPVDREVLVHRVRAALPDARVDSAADGFEGLVLIGRLAPRLVITDIQMPYMDGFQMIRSLLTAPAAEHCSIIAVSALAAEDLALVGTLPAGVGFFSKPVPVPAFTDAVRHAVAGAPGHR